MDVKSRACNWQLDDTYKETPLCPQEYLMSDKDNTPHTNRGYRKPKRQRCKRIKLEVFVRRNLPKLLLRYQKYLDTKI